MLNNKTIQELRDECKRLGIQYLTKDTSNKLQQKIKQRIMATETKKGNITPEQIEAWKKDHKKVYKLSVTVTEGDVAVGYLKKPSRNHKATAMSMYSQNKILESGEFLRDNCWLGGDERLRTSEDIADTAAIKASGIFQFLESDLGEV